MKLSVMNPVLNSMGFEEALAYLESLGVDTIEIGAGGFPGDNHLKPEELLKDAKNVEAYKALLAKHHLEISAISCHGNPLHPQKEIAEKFDQEFKNAILAAEALGVDTVIGFAGCPGDCENSLYPNWVTCPWPDDFGKILDWQWNEKVIPYWKNMAEFAKAHSISKIAFEMHPGFVVYNPETLLRLRAAVGDIIGANFDPSHLFWQGIDPVAAIKALEGAIYHFHAKDTRIDERNCAVNGVLDNKGYGDIMNRSWVFRTVGYGHDAKVWNDIISTLKTIGYDGAISIEHEDGLMSPKEGLEKAISFLKNVLIYENAGEMWWA
ncbi:MAG: sugar phosphate isomerase/epimerase [Ruminococcaceae bacterium]|nr:sugar phosphate isomerase/epimerase [Oscillospiraceae bacterium]